MRTRNYKQFEIGFARYKGSVALLFRLADTDDGHGEKLAYRFAITTDGKTDENTAAIELKRWLDKHADDEFPSKAASADFVLTIWPDIERNFSETPIQFSDREILALREATDWKSPERTKAEKDLEEYFPA